MWHDLARAKVNLCLHVTGQRKDGLHLLESLVVFPEIGDQVTLEKSEDLRLSVDGPFGHALSGDNLILAAARMMGVSGHFHLTKNLPVASGIGGGSSDAAAAIRLIAQAFDLNIPDAAGLMSLGADVPVCVESRPAIMSGAGEAVNVIDVPPFGIVLVNAGEPVSTAAVFKALKSKNNPPMDQLPDLSSGADLFTYLQNQRNDLEQSAIAACPVIADILSALSRDSNCALSRMSGSGGTCFGLFETSAQAKSAADRLRSEYPNWGVQ